jgi:hypothetical protein
MFPLAKTVRDAKFFGEKFGPGATSTICFCLSLEQKQILEPKDRFHRAGGIE